jgi:hypothetical protein
LHDSVFHVSAVEEQNNRLGRLQAHKAALVNSLRHLTLTLDDGVDLKADDPEVKLVLAYTSLIHEQRILFRAQPSTDVYTFLKSLIEAAFTARATSQAGLVSYLLLGAATSAVEDLFQLARGNEECFTALSSWEKATITHRGETLWSHAVKVSRDNTGVIEFTPDLQFE